MNQETFKKLTTELNGFLQNRSCDRIYFKIERDKKGKRYTIAITVYRHDGFADIPASIFPKFNKVMDAYIYCVGIIHTAYQDMQAYFTSGDNAIWKELCQLQDDNGDDEYAENQAKEKIAAAMGQHNNRNTKKKTSKQEIN